MYLLVLLVFARLDDLLSGLELVGRGERVSDGHIHVDGLIGKVNGEIRVLASHATDAIEEVLRVLVNLVSSCLRGAFLSD
jgi:hypothetical protein